MGDLSGRPQQLVDEPEVQIGLCLVGPGRQHPQADALGLGRQRRARAVFPTPGSPSMATSHGWPVSTGR